MSADRKGERVEARQAWPRVVVVVGGIVSACGLLSIGTYVWSALIERIGEPDQSLIFWYLPILFIGIIALGLGLAAIALGVSRLRHPK